MGIRYYACPLPDSQVMFARLEPEAFMSRDPLADAWGLIEVDYETGQPIDSEPRPQPEVLYLDKCWRELQLLFGDEDGPFRTSFDLVRGAVTMTPRGWIPYFGVLDADEVTAVAQNIDQVTAADVDHLLEEHPELCRDDDDGERKYILDLLGDAQQFVASMMKRGWGLIYMIG
ncbi:hypothetical protein QCD70_00425 [Agreia sp. PsM10]|uniref:hypothetical protein n=1 Tax=Agreia sp. PsM10 TaxID=3030533 RepID=UPI00263A3E41|nr:hypothetical protein [Agreia sp. PsM10]MDN4638698.1 hypothetical protein [Agreia sp. PsM10]